MEVKEPEERMRNYKKCKKCNSSLRRVHIELEARKDSAYLWTLVCKKDINHSLSKEYQKEISEIWKE